MRTSLRLAVLVPAVLIAMALVLASCSTTPATPPTSGTPASSGTSPRVAASPTPSKPSGSLTIGWSFSSSGNLTWAGNIYAGLGSAVYESLITLTPEGKSRPNIAERWEIAPDGLSHTFYIRKGVKFHDESALTAADVKFSFDRILASANNYNGAERAGWVQAVDKVEIKDDYTVVLRLKQPAFQLLEGMDPPRGISAVVSKKYFEAKGEDLANKNPIGTGPWKVVKWEPGVRLDLEAFENHWRVVPQYKNVTILWTPEEASRVAMLKTGELDVAVVSPDSAAGLKSAGLRILPFDGGSQVYAFWWWDKDDPKKLAIGDVRVRKAMSLATDRKELADKLFLGYAEPGVMAWVRPTAEFWGTNVPKPDPYDPEQAKKLLAEAGYPNGFSTTLWDTRQVSLISILTEAVAGYWGKIGINATVLPVDYAAVVVKSYSPKVTPDAWNKTYIGMSGGNMWQFEGFPRNYSTAPSRVSNNPKIDDLINKIPSTRDAAESRRMMLEAAITGKDEYQYLGFLEAKTIFAIGSKVGEFKPVSGGASFWGPVYETITHAK